MDFFIIENDEQRGPFTLEQLSGMNIFADTPVWHEGLSDWTQASKIDELKDIVINISQPSKRSSMPPKWDSSKAGISQEVAKEPAESPKKPKKSHKALWLSLGAVAVLAIVLAVSNPNEEDHCREITSVTRSWVSEKIDDFEMNNLIGGVIKSISTKLIRSVVDDNVKVDNYVLFSIGYIDDGAEKTRVSFGILGNVFTFNKEQLDKKLEESMSKYIDSFMGLGDFFSFDGNIGDAIVDGIVDLIGGDLIGDGDHAEEAVPGDESVDSEESSESLFSMPSLKEGMLKEGAKMVIKEGADYLMDKVDDM